MTGSWSAVLAAHNGAGFIEEQLRSILDQTVAPALVLVGDDASLDGTLRSVQRVAASHPLGDRVVVVARDRALGVVGNFEDLLGRTTTEIVALADQDDRWAPTRIEQLLARFDAEPALLMLHHDAELIDADGRALGGLFQALRIGPDALADEQHGRAFERLLRRNLVTGATAVLRRELVQLAGPVPAGWIHDEWLAIMAASVDGLGVEEARLIDYRQHAGNQIGAQRLDIHGVRARFSEDGVARNSRLLARAESLRAALERIPSATEHRRELARSKVLHERRRTELPSPRWRRIRPALVEWRNGGYAAFGNGLPDLVRDLLQPKAISN